MVSDVLRAFSEKPEVSAVAINAADFREDRLIGYSRWDAKDRYLRSPQALLANYFQPSTGVAPCPGYFFRLAVADDLKGSLRGGKYADIWMIIHALKSGEIFWLGQIGLLYRRHAEQDSHEHSVFRKFCLFKAVTQVFPIARDSSLYRWFFLQNMKHFLKRKQKGLFQGFLQFRRNRLAFYFLIRACFDIDTVLLFLRKMFWKCLRQFQPLSGDDQLVSEKLLSSIKEQVP
jgi:hypothetical protein